MSAADNPAGRLLDLIQKAKLANMNIGNQPAKFGWAEVFAVPYNNAKEPSFSTEHEEALINYLIQLRLLINETEQALRGVEGINTERYLSPFPRIRSMVRITDLNSPFPNIINPISEGDLVVLGFCSDKLSEQHLEVVIDDEQLNELLKDVDSLYEVVLASSIDRELKNVILDLLQVIRSAIHEYHVRGVSRLKEALPVLVGTFILNKDLIEQESSKEEVGLLRQILGRYSSLVATASHTSRLIEAAATYIPPLLPGG